MVPAMPPSILHLARRFHHAALLALAGTAALAADASWGAAPPATQVGLASFYGRAFDGKKTASGERFDSDDLTAAHPSYPLGTRVRVTNLKNGHSVVLRVTDRGPTSPNRREGVIIDVSRAAAARLQMRREGRTRVRVHVLEWGDEEKVKREAAAGKPG